MKKQKLQDLTTYLTLINTVAIVALSWFTISALMQIEAMASVDADSLQQQQISQLRDCIHNQDIECEFRTE